MKQDAEKVYTEPRKPIVVARIEAAYFSQVVVT